ncbi:DUF2254 domain-containing protein [Ilumatobacter sp.]|uniref:DUF2254 domain-containing protein n=1 Tax=Ilumatobacter sp. TaxID=1967498 RepID=UPI003B519032
MIDSLRDFFAERFGWVRIDQVVDRIRHRLTFVPVVYVVVSLIVSQLLLWGDRTVWADSLPVLLTTTVTSARSVFAALAGGLITSITLVMSMMLVAVQLASSQFSPRTLRDWLSDRVLQHTIGLVLGTTVFNLMALRSTRSFAEDGREVVPHVTVLVAVVLGVVSLVAVVRSVDHLTHSLRIGSVAERIATATIAAIRSSEDVRPGQGSAAVPAASEIDPRHVGPDEVPDGAAAVEAWTTGWMQQFDSEAVIRALPEGATGHVVATLGGFVVEGTPLMWISPPPDEEDECWDAVLHGFAIGDSRTLQSDVAFGILQLTDIAQRALSPGINDPSTANDVLVHLGAVLLAAWSLPTVEAVRSEDGRTLVRTELGHADLLHRALDPIRRDADDDPSVLMTMMRQVLLVRSEALRRQLPGPIGPLDEFVREALRMIDGSTWRGHDVDELVELVTSIGLSVDRTAFGAR